VVKLSLHIRPEFLQDVRNRIGADLRQRALHCGTEALVVRIIEISDRSHASVANPLEKLNRVPPRRSRYDNAAQRIAYSSHFLPALAEVPGSSCKMDGITASVI